MRVYILQIYVKSLYTNSAENMPEENSCRRIPEIGDIPHIRYAGRKDKKADCDMTNVQGINALPKKAAFAETSETY